MISKTVLIKARKCKLVLARVRPAGFRQNAAYKSVLSRHPVYTMHMRGAAAQGWSAEGLTVTQWIIGHNSSGSEAGAWFSLTLSPTFSRVSRRAVVQLDSGDRRNPSASSPVPGFGAGRNVLLLCMLSRPRSLQARSPQKAHVRFVWSDASADAKVLRGSNRLARQISARSASRTSNISTCGGLILENNLPIMISQGNRQISYVMYNNLITRTLQDV